MEQKNLKTIAQNKKAWHDYYVLDSFEAGIELVGTEVKSVRGGNVNLKDSWCSVSKQNELFLNGMHISPYEHGNIFNVDPVRVRKLLMHKKQIFQLAEKVSREGLTIVPLSLYFKNSKIKVQIGLCKGKKNYDKRETIAKRDAKRDIDRALKQKYR